MTLVWKRTLTLLFITVSFSSFAQDKLFTLVPPDSSGVNFFNHIFDTKQLNVIGYEYFYNGAGVAIGDVNNDGLPDIYFSSNMFDCRLYLNQGNLKFKDVTKEAGVDGGIGYKNGVTMVDVNNDHWMDIYVCRTQLDTPEQRKNILYVNNKDGTFTNRAAEYGVDDEGYTTQAYFNDTDHDGDLDLFVVNHPFNIGNAKTIHLTYNDKGVLEAVRDKPTQYETCKFYENVNGKFVDRTKEAGLTTHAFGLSAIMQDFNDDGLVDIYQANDYIEPDYLFINKGNNKFVNEFDKYFKHSSFLSMGSDHADINNDGHNDLIVVDMLPEGNARLKQLYRGNNYDEFEKTLKYGFGRQYVKNVVQVNNGNASYSDVSYFTGMAWSDWSWAVLIADFDNDGWKDVYITNGFMRDIGDQDYVKFNMDSITKELYKLKDDDAVLKLLAVIPSVKVQNSYFKNYGNLDFQKESKESGLEQHAWSFGAAYADLDNDGDLEIVVNNTNDYAFIYKNNTVENKAGNSVRVRLEGPPLNLNGIGTLIETATPDGSKQSLLFNPMKGYLSSHDKTSVIGIGNNATADIHITWPDGKKQSINKVAAGNLIVADYKNAVMMSDAPSKKAPLFKDITSSVNLDYTYSENNYIDYKLEPLLPRKFSEAGPCLAVGDVNGDKTEDLFIGGAKDRAAVFFLQDKDGKFSISHQAVLDKDKGYEDGAASLTDFDNDGDRDLIVSCGGNEYPNQPDKYPVRLYINDGKGNFTKANFCGNKIFTSSIVVAAEDYDKNGSVDFFIGGKIVPGHYGIIPKSFLISNANGTLTDVTDTTYMSKIGMVSSAIWTDLDNNGWKDLVLCGDWMPVTIFYNRDGKLDSRPLLINNSYGWWNRITAFDMDGDGDQDLIGGNLGLNTRYTGTVDKPMTIVVSDFDENGSTDCIISVFIKDNSYPITIRDYVVDQMPYLKKKYRRYKQYANATISDMFTAEQLKKASFYIANNMQSTLFINDGGTSFSQKALPTRAQLFPVNGIQVTDANKDGLPDLLLVGNDYATEVETGRNDAGIGLVLINKGDNDFKTLEVGESGFYVPGNARCLEQIKIKEQVVYVAGKNSEHMQVVALDK